MRIVIIAVGSHGDVYPLLALGMGLKKASYSICIATHSLYKDLVESKGLEFSDIRMDFKAFMKSDGGKAFQDQKGKATKSLRGMLKLLKESTPELENLLMDCIVACKGADAIISAAILPGYHIAEKLGVKFFQVGLYPISPTSEYPCPLIPFNLKFGRMFNKFTYFLVEQLSWLVLKKPTNMWRKKLGLHKINNKGALRYFRVNDVPYLYGYSSNVIPKPSDWPKCNYVTGYWFLEEPEDWKPPLELVEFINNGSPPIYIGFGSMVEEQPERLTNIAIQALRESGQRGIISSGWSGLGNIQLPEFVYLVDSIPHSWLFPRMAGIVHHGGAGTTAASIKAGVPSIIIPFLGDQFYWGNQVYKIGIGTKPLSHNRLSAKSLADSISTMVADKEMHQRVKKLSKIIKHEDGISNAITIINRYMS